MALIKGLTIFSKLSNLCDLTKLSKVGAVKNAGFMINVRTTKHWNPRFKWFRSKKIIPVVLPHTKEAKEIFDDQLKDMKIFPRYWKPRPLTLTTSGEVFDPYKPPDGDGKASKVSTAVYGAVKNTAANKISNTRSIRKIKNFEPNFTQGGFLQEAHDIYVKAHTTLMQNDPEELSKYVTEMANTEMMNGLKNTTLVWKFIESLEPPKFVQARTEEIVVKKNLFAQITVRFHTKQSLAIYDRFGRLMFGSEILAKDVLEYIVFEKHLNNEYGVWRLHAKIIPEFNKPTASYSRTYMIKDVKEYDDNDDEDDVLEEDYYGSESELEPVAKQKATDIAKAEAKSSN